MNVLVRGARLVDGDGEVLDATDLRMADGVVAAIGRGLAVESGDDVVAAAGRVMMPGWVDAHTHALWAGDRLDEFERRLAGASYLELLAVGGGIMATVRAVRAASLEHLVAALERRLAIALGEGTTTIEVKSGYGLTTADELKMLRAIDLASMGFPGTVIKTALLGHAIDRARPAFVDEVIAETLPAVHEAHPDIAVDVYCEEGAWTLAETRRLLEAAVALGHPVRMHADQFTPLGGIELAVELGARSVDHLEATDAAGLRKLAEAGIFGVMLPACALHGNERFADGRAFLDAGGRLVLASNCNPGSAPTTSMPLVVALAARRLGVRLPEAVRAVTREPAALLGLPDRGRIAVGARADLVLLRHHDPRELAYELGGNPVEAVFCGGVRVPPR